MIYILLAMILYTAAIMLGSQASRRLDPTLSAAIMNLVSTIIPLTLAFKLFNGKLFTSGRTGLLFALSSGILIALFTIVLAKGYATSKVAVVTPIVFGGSIFLTAVLSSVFLKEKITLLQGMGLLFVLVGLSLVVYARAVGK